MTRVAKHFLRLDRNRKPRMKTLWHPGYQFPSFSIFSHETCHVTIINGYVTRRPQDILLGKKNSSCSSYPSERYCQSIIFSEHSLDLCQDLNWVEQYILTIRTWFPSVIIRKTIEIFNLELYTSHKWSVLMGLSLFKRRDLIRSFL